MSDILDGSSIESPKGIVTAEPVPIQKWRPRTDEEKRIYEAATDKNKSATVTALLDESEITPIDTSKPYPYYENASEEVKIDDFVRENPKAMQAVEALVKDILVLDANGEALNKPLEGKEKLDRMKELVERLNNRGEYRGKNDLLVAQITTFTSRHPDLETVLPHTMVMAAEAELAKATEEENKKIQEQNTKNKLQFFAGSSTDHRRDVATTVSHTADVARIGDQYESYFDDKAIGTISREMPKNDLTAFTLVADHLMDIPNTTTTANGETFRDQMRKLQATAYSETAPTEEKAKAMKELTAIRRDFYEVALEALTTLEKTDDLNGTVTERNKLIAKMKETLRDLPKKGISAVVKGYKGVGVEENGNIFKKTEERDRPQEITEQFKDDADLMMEYAMKGADLMKRRLFFKPEAPQIPLYDVPTTIHKKIFVQGPRDVLQKAAGTTTGDNEVPRVTEPKRAAQVTQRFPAPPTRRLDVTEPLRGAQFTERLDLLQTRDLRREDLPAEALPVAPIEELAEEGERFRLQQERQERAAPVTQILEDLSDETPEMRLVLDFNAPDRLEKEIVDNARHLFSYDAKKKPRPPSAHTFPGNLLYGIRHPGEMWQTAVISKSRLAQEMKTVTALTKELKLHGGVNAVVPEDFPPQLLEQIEKGAAEYRTRLERNPLKKMSMGIRGLLTKATGLGTTTDGDLMQKYFREQLALPIDQRDAQLQTLLQQAKDQSIDRATDMAERHGLITDTDSVFTSGSISDLDQRGALRADETRKVVEVNGEMGNHVKELMRTFIEATHGQNLSPEDMKIQERDLFIAVNTYLRSSPNADLQLLAKKPESVNNVVALARQINSNYDQYFKQTADGQIDDSVWNEVQLALVAGEGNWEEKAKNTRENFFVEKLAKRLAARTGNEWLRTGGVADRLKAAVEDVPLLAAILAQAVAPTVIGKTIGRVATPILAGIKSYGRTMDEAAQSSAEAAYGAEVGPNSPIREKMQEYLIHRESATDMAHKIEQARLAIEQSAPNTDYAQLQRDLANIVSIAAARLAGNDESGVSGILMNKAANFIQFSQSGRKQEILELRRSILKGTNMLQNSPDFQRLLAETGATDAVSWLNNAALAKQVQLVVGSGQANEKAITNWLKKNAKANDGTPLSQQQEDLIRQLALSSADMSIDREQSAQRKAYLLRGLARMNAVATGAMAVAGGTAGAFVAGELHGLITNNPTPLGRWIGGAVKNVFEQNPLPHIVSGQTAQYAFNGANVFVPNELQVDTASIPGHTIVVNTFNPSQTVDITGMHFQPNPAGGVSITDSLGNPVHNPLLENISTKTIPGNPVSILTTQQAANGAGQAPNIATIQQHDVIIPQGTVIDAHDPTNIELVSAADHSKVLVSHLHYDATQHAVEGTTVANAQVSFTQETPGTSISTPEAHIDTNQWHEWSKTKDGGNYEVHHYEVDNTGIAKNGELQGYDAKVHLDNGHDALRMSMKAEPYDSITDHTFNPPTVNFDDEMKQGHAYLSVALPGKLLDDHNPEIVLVKMDHYDLTTHSAYLDLDPNADPHQMVTLHNGTQIPMRDFARSVINANAFNAAPLGDLATEVRKNYDMFNLGTDGPQHGHIEYVFASPDSTVVKSIITIRGGGAGQVPLQSTWTEPSTQTATLPGSIKLTTDWTQPGEPQVEYTLAAPQPAPIPESNPFPELTTPDFYSAPGGQNMERAVWKPEKKADAADLDQLDELPPELQKKFREIEARYREEEKSAYLNGLPIIQKDLYDLDVVGFMQKYNRFGLTREQIQEAMDDPQKADEMATNIIKQTLVEDYINSPETRKDIEKEAMAQLSPTDATLFTAYTNIYEQPKTRTDEEIHAGIHIAGMSEAEKNLRLQEVTEEQLVHYKSLRATVDQAMETILKEKEERYAKRIDAVFAEVKAQQQTQNQTPLTSTRNKRPFTKKEAENHERILQKPVSELTDTDLRALFDDQMAILANTAIADIDDKLKEITDPAIRSQSENAGPVTQRLGILREEAIQAAIQELLNAAVGTDGTKVITKEETDVISKAISRLKELAKQEDAINPGELALDEASELTEAAHFYLQRYNSNPTEAQSKRSLGLFKNHPPMSEEEYTTMKRLISTAEERIAQLEVSIPEIKIAEDLYKKMQSYKGGHAAFAFTQAPYEVDDTIATPVSTTGDILTAHTKIKVSQKLFDILTARSSLESLKNKMNETKSERQHYDVDRYIEEVEIALGVVQRDPKTGEKMEIKELEDRDAPPMEAEANTAVEVSPFSESEKTAFEGLVERINADYSADPKHKTPLFDYNFDFTPEEVALLEKVIPVAETKFKEKIKGNTEYDELQKYLGEMRAVHGHFGEWLNVKVDPQTQTVYSKRDSRGIQQVFMPQAIKDLYDAENTIESMQSDVERYKSGQARHTMVTSWAKDIQNIWKLANES